MQTNDRPLLEYKLNRLQIGVVYHVGLKTNLNRSSWKVYSKKDIIKLIKIFDIHQLNINTSKQIKYLSWKEAFLINISKRNKKKKMLLKICLI